MTALEKAQAKYARAEAELKSMLRLNFPPNTIVQLKSGYPRGTEPPRARVVGLSSLYPEALQLEGGYLLGGHVSWWRVEKVKEND